MKLKVARAEKDLTQWDLALKAGVSQAKVSLIERGHIVPSDDDRQRMAAALGLEADQIDWPGTMLTGGDLNVGEA